MSDVCGRRRLAKLAFVTGASGKLRGFLEEPKDNDKPSDFRLTDPFAFHGAFLEVVPPGVDGVSAPGVSFHSGFLQATADFRANPSTNSTVVLLIVSLLVLSLVGWVILNSVSWVSEKSQFQGGKSNQNPNGENQTKNEQQNHVFGALVGKAHNSDLSVSGAIDPFVEGKVCLEGNGCCQ